MSIVRRNTTTDADRRAQTIVNAGTGPGLVAAGVLALVLLPNWRLAWAVVAVFTMAVAALVLMLDRPAGDGASERTAEAHGALPPASWFRAHGLVVTAALLMGAGSAAVWTYGRTLLLDAGASSSLSVAAWIALGIGGTAVIGTTRWMSPVHPRTVWTLTGSAAALATALLGVLPMQTGVALAACVVFGWGYTAGSGALIAWTTEIDAPRASSGASLLFITLILGQALGATLGGQLLATSGSSTAFLAASVVTAVAAAVPALRSTRPAGPDPVRAAGS